MIGIEAVIEKQMAILKAEMPTRLDMLDILYGDFELPDIQSWWVEEADSEHPPYPAVFIFEENPDILNRATALLNVGYVTSIYVWDEADVQGLPQMSKRLWRYRRAIVEILGGHRKEAGYWDSTLPMEFIASPAMKNGPATSPYLKCKAVFYQTNVKEDF